jgi:hypothetical protein
MDNLMKKKNGGKRAVVTGMKIVVQMLFVEKSIRYTRGCCYWRCGETMK